MGDSKPAVPILYQHSSRLIYKHMSHANKIQSHVVDICLPGWQNEPVVGWKRNVQGFKPALCHGEGCLKLAWPLATRIGVSQASLLASSSQPAGRVITNNAARLYACHVLGSSDLMSPGKLKQVSEMRHCS